MNVRPGTHSSRIVRAAAVLAGVCAAAACSSAPNPPAAAPATAAASPATADPAATVGVVPQGPPHVTVSRIRTADGSVVTVAVFSGRVQYVLHNGSQDPGPAYAALVLSLIHI